MSMDRSAFIRRLLDAAAERGVAGEICYESGESFEGADPAQSPSVASGRKRYNTLDFASKVVCQQGAARPYWMILSRGVFPSDSPLFSSQKGAFIAKTHFCAFLRKYKTAASFILYGDEICSGLLCLADTIYVYLVSSDVGKLLSYHSTASGFLRLWTVPAVQSVGR